MNKYLPSRKGLLGINGRNLDYIYTHNPRGLFPRVDDKLKCKILLNKHGIPTPETLHVVENLFEIKSWREGLKNISQFVIKPNKSFGGQGIVLLKRDGEKFLSGNTQWDLEDVDFHVSQILNGAFAREGLSDFAFFEQRIFNHEDFIDLIPEEIGGVADIRIIFQRETPVMAMMRLPTYESGGKANLHQGGIGLGVNMETGITVNGCYGNKVIKLHPDTGKTLRGWAVPGFEEMITYGKKISEIVELGYIGVDYVVDRSDGPLVLEVNARPGLNIQIANEEGLRHKLQ